ncbi:MAG: hypothetical protein AB8G05_19975 [Oligoflexales bacterium]
MKIGLSIFFAFFMCSQLLASPYTASSEAESFEEENELGYSDEDILSGRGGLSNNHPGNIFFRRVINDHKKEYLKLTARRDKAEMVNEILDFFKDERVRFMKRNSEGVWKELLRNRAYSKVSQALRE